MTDLAHPKSPLSAAELTDAVRWLQRDKYHGAEGAVTEEDLQRLKDGEPLAYVIGWVPFLGCRIELNERPLIPRVETEQWVSEILSVIKNRHTVLDLCCGSGCIGIAVLKHLPNAHVTFADISPAAIRQTQHNLTVNEIDPHRVTVIESDLFAQIDPAVQFDWILTNPPYIDRDGEYSGDIAAEPEKALFAQNHGFALIEQIIQTAQKHLVIEGKLVVEFGIGQAEKIQKAGAAAGWQNITIYEDQFGVPRWAMLTRGE